MPRKNPDKIQPKWNYCVTFERLNDPPVAVRGTVEGSTFQTAAQRAVKDARKQAKRTRADSLVILLERNDGANDFKI